MTFGIMNHFDVAIFDDAAEATAAGFKYGQSVTPVEIKKAVVVRKGTKAGNPTVDLLLHDQNGKQYVVMITGALLSTIPCHPRG